MRSSSKAASIAALARLRRSPPRRRSDRFGGGILAPGFIDWQINGGGGVLFNAEPTVEGIAAIAAAHRREGVTGFLPTVVTDAPEVLAAALAAAREAQRSRAGRAWDPCRRAIHRSATQGRASGRVHPPDA